MRLGVLRVVLGLALIGGFLGEWTGAMVLDAISEKNTPSRN
jgi:hypothetical protein